MGVKTDFFIFFQQKVETEVCKFGKGSFRFCIIVPIAMDYHGVTRKSLNDNNYSRTADRRRLLSPMELLLDDLDFF